MRPDGRQLYFIPTQADPTVYRSDSDVVDTIKILADASGALTGWKYTSADDEVEIYDRTGKLLSITNRNGLKHTLSYDAKGRLISVSDTFGRSLKLTYNSANLLASLTDPAGWQYLFAYDNNGSLISITYPDGKVKTYLYEVSDAPWLLTGIIDESSNRFATYAYDSQRRAVLSTHAGGVNRTALAYNLDGTTTVTDALGTARSYNFTTINSVKKTTGLSQPCAGCGDTTVRNLTYDTNGNIASRTDFNGTITTYQYDLTRNLETSRTEAASTTQARTITTQWHSTFRLPTRIAEPGRTTAFTYDSRGNLLTKTVTDTASGQSRTWTYTYNVRGQILTEDGPRTDVSDITTYAYYTANAADGSYRTGDLQSVTNALGHVTQFSAYDAHGRPKTIRDPNNLITQLDYWPRGWLKSRQVGTEPTYYEYSPTGLLKKVTLPDGSYLSYSYDKAHRLTDIQDNLGNKIHYTLDLLGNRKNETVFDPGGVLAQKHAWTYGALGRLSQDLGAWDLSPAVTETTRYGYDGNGNLQTVTDAVGNATTYQYDPLNRLTRVLDPAVADQTPVRGETKYDYDALDHLISVTDPRGLATTYAYDGLDNLKIQTSPETGITAHTYDAAGNLKTTQDARYQGTGKQTSHLYDALNRVTQTTFADATQLKYSYDGSAPAKGRLTLLTDPKGSTGWTYNAMGRVTRKQQLIGPVSLTLRYGYDGFGRLSSATYPSGRQIQYGYDTAGRVSSVSVDGTMLVKAITYQPFGAVAGWTWANGTTYRRSFEGNGLVQSYPLGPNLRTVSFDNDLRIASYTEPGATQTFDYDPLSRLSGFTSAAFNQSYTYDAVGNRDTRFTVGQGSGTTNYTYASTSNRLTAVDATAWLYDAAGHLTHKGSNVTYTYNARGRLSSATVGTVTTNYTLNGLDQRVRKDAPATLGSTRWFAYDEAGHLIGYYDANNRVIQETVYLGDLPLAVLTGDGLLVDNDMVGQTTVAGNWASEAVTKGYQGADYRTHTAGGTDSFTWTPPVTASGSYRVYARWPSGAGRATNAPYTVTHAGGQTTVAANQTGNSGQWNYLGTFTFIAGAGHHVSLSANANGAVAADAIKLLPVAPGRYYVHADHLNTPRVLTTTAHTMVWRWDSDPFGVGAPNQDPDGNGVQVVYNWRFPGQFFDAETGLHYNYFRDYDPRVGRYIQSDPIGLRGGINTFAYVGGNPISRFDPTGLIVEIRCRPIGAPYNPEFRSSVARFLGGEHCYLTVSCPLLGISETTISYLGPTYVVPRGGEHNNDTTYSALGKYRVVPHIPPPSTDCKDQCKFEQCLITYASMLKYIDYRMDNYNAVLGPNSNSFVRRLIEMCGGSALGPGPLTGWNDADKVKF